MPREWKIAGIYDNDSGKWQKLIYVHSDSEGNTCVNGRAAALVIRRVCEQDAGGGFGIVCPPSAELTEGAFLSVRSGETMLRIGTHMKLSVVCPGFVGVSAAAESLRPIRAGVLTVSDKASRGERDDTSGPALSDMVRAIGSVVERCGIVPDERDAIAGRLREWADGDGLDLVLVTGGTGLSKRDVTPEALMDIQEKTAPGFGEIMRAHSMLYTPRGFLSRGTAVTRGGTLIIAMPGSERAARQCFEAIAQSLRHGIGALRGWDSECGN